MWPHSLVLAIGESAVCVGTDDAALAEQLRPWQLATDLHDAQVQLVDYAIELHPPKPQHRAAPRTLPSLRHGTAILGRGTDLDALRNGFLRVLGSFAAPVPHGCVRLLGLPLLRDGAVDLVPPDMAGHLSSRWLHQRGFTPVYVASVVVDTRTLEVHIDAPLATSADDGIHEPTALVAPLRRWWCALPDPAAALGFGRFVAFLAHRLAPPASAADDQAGSAVLAALIRLVERLPPERIGFGHGDLLTRLGEP